MKRLGGIVAVGLALGCLPEIEAVANPPVRDLAVVDPARGQTLELSWTNPEAPGFVRVRVLRAEGDAAPALADDEELIAELTGGEERFVDEGLVDGTRYSYAVFAGYEDGTFARPATGSAVPTDEAGPAPARDVVADAGDNAEAVSLSWTVDDPDVVRARVTRGGAEIASQPDGADDPLACNGGVPGEAPCVDVGSEPITLRYEIVLVDGADLESEAVIVDVEVANTRPPNPSTDLTTTPDPGGGVELRWRHSGFFHDWVRTSVIRTLESAPAPSAPGDGDEVLFLERVAGGPPPADLLGEYIRVDDTGAPGTRYRYTLFDLDFADNVTVGASAIAAPHPGPVADLVATPLDTGAGPTGQIRLSWTTPAGVSRLRVQRDQGPDTEEPLEDNGLAVCDVSAAPFPGECVDDPVLDGETVHYAVFTYDDAGARSTVERVSLTAPSALVPGAPVEGDGTGNEAWRVSPSPGGAFAITSRQDTGPFGEPQCFGLRVSMVDATGTPLWSTCATGGLRPIELFALDDDRVLLTAINDSGSDTAIAGTGPVAPANSVVAARLSSSDGGRVDWVVGVDCPQHDFGFADANASGAALAVPCDGAPLFVNGVDRSDGGRSYVLALDPDGVERWVFSTTALPTSAALSLFPNGDVGFAFGADGISNQDGPVGPVTFAGRGFLTARLAASDGAVLDVDAQLDVATTALPNFVYAMAGTSDGAVVAVLSQDNSTLQAGALGPVQLFNNDLLLFRLDGTWRPSAAHVYALNEPPALGEGIRLRHLGGPEAVLLVQTDSTTPTELRGHGLVIDAPDGVALAVGRFARWFLQPLDISSPDPLGVVDAAPGVLLGRLEGGDSLLGVTTNAAGVGLVLLPVLDRGVP